MKSAYTHGGQRGTLKHLHCKPVRVNSTLSVLISTPEKCQYGSTSTGGKVSFNKVLNVQQPILCYTATKCTVDSAIIVTLLHY